ncbi:SRPBCC family protein [Caenimonas aquaedulcis]|uniref:SRPBCC family protein n=1 Tax=Caenimonas aquaedulcis TaxID=2793270 RepID=A0A931H5D4_9BURK|nr:SRPBCC family protein [Caenimonas aquaedulcis]MBG9388919.1 SRPBCC family protein [Caenimonas aquaedulcis]
MTGTPTEDTGVATTRKTLPFSKAWPIAAGALAGVALRLIFLGKAGQAYAPMMAAFIYCAPILVGAVTVYVAERVARRSWGYYVWSAFLANCFFVLGTLMIMVEGLICAAVIIPVFAAFGALGGLAMGLVCRLTHWPKQTLYVAWAVPLLLGALETQIPLAERVRSVEQTRLIAAPPERVWAEIQTARDIQPSEVEDAWFFRIGVPLPRAGTSRLAGGERVRTLSLGKEVHFDQVVTDWDENRRVRWNHRYAPDSFPPYALDEHVVLGGRYFDITSTEYRLQPKGSATELSVRMDYRVSTPFNWYADPVAGVLLRNFEGVLLKFYARRSEALHLHP